MGCDAKYLPQLRAPGFCMTSQHMAILQVRDASGILLSPLKALERARQQVDGLTLPAVYRTLEFLTENGLVQPQDEIVSASS